MGVEVNPEKNGKEGEKDVEKGKAEPAVDEACWIIRAVEVSVLYSTPFDSWMDLYLGVLHRTFRTH